MSEPNVDRLLALYPDDCGPQRIEHLGGAGGFSGAAFWRLATPRGLLCLRRWPPQADSKWSQRLGFIHAVLEHIQRRGFSLVPAPIRTRQGESYVQLENQLWELTPWLPGHADYFPLRRPEKLRAALAALARFHCAAAEFHCAAAEFYCAAAEFHGATADLVGPNRQPAPSPGIRARRSQIGGLRSGGLHAIATAIDAASPSSSGIDRQNWLELGQLARRLLPLYAQAEERVLRQLRAAEPLKVPLQPCIRDIWHDHVLFEGDRVSGLIDFGAMRIDNVAGDVARLLGSLAQGENENEAGVWQAGLAAYEAVRPLSADERHLVGVFDGSTTLLAGIHWLKWLFLEGRTFADPAAVILRLGGIVARLERLTQA